MDATVHLDAFEPNELQVLVIEPIVSNDLLQEGNDLDGLVFIWPRKVDVLEVQNQAVTAARPQHSACVCADRLPAHLTQLLDRILGSSLRTAVHHCC